jgi:hypothetical protein
MFALSRFGKFHPATGLHDGCGVYCLIRQGRVMYVGMSTNVFSRLRRWRSYGLSFDDARVIFVPKADLRDTEARLIRFFSPPWNTAGMVPGNGHKPERAIKPSVAEVLAGLLPAPAPPPARLSRRF